MNNKHSQKQIIARFKKKAIEANRTLAKYVLSFLKDCIGKDEEQVKKIYEEYNFNWVAFCKIQRAKNNRSKSYNAHTNHYQDAFSSACDDGRIQVINAPKKEGVTKEEHNIEIKEYKRIFRIVEYKTNIGKLIYWFEKHFFVASTKYNPNGTLKIQLTNNVQ